MSVIWIVAIAIVVVFFSVAFWLISKNVSTALADIRHGKGIFLSFNYTPEEWDHYTQTLPLTGNRGKVCLTKNHIYITDGTEEILYEIARLRAIAINNDFVVFTVRNKELVANEDGTVVPDSPDNLKEYYILISKAQQQETDNLISFYQKRIKKEQ